MSKLSVFISEFDADNITKETIKEFVGYLSTSDKKILTANQGQYKMYCELYPLFENFNQGAIEMVIKEMGLTYKTLIGNRVPMFKKAIELNIDYKKFKAFNTLDKANKAVSKGLAKVSDNGMVIMYEDVADAAKTSSESVFYDSYAKFQSTDYYALMLNMTIEELRDVQEFIPIMIRGGTDEYNQIKSISLETTWQDYEKIIMNEFIAAGASAHLTKEGSDGGIDIIAELNEIKIGVQVKFLSTKVSSSVVGEVLMGMGMHDCDYGCVVAISGYTKPCKNQSLKNDVKLLHFSDIKKYINRIRQKNIRKL